MEHFFTSSEQVRQIVKGLELTRGLYVSSIIIGEEATGKKTLIRYLFPDTPVVSGSDQEAVENALNTGDELVIVDFEKLKNKDTLDFDGKRIVATASYMGNPQVIDRLFAFIYTMPPLRERSGDIEYLVQHFIRQATNDLMLEETEIDSEHIELDTSVNAKSLKRSVYKAVLTGAMTKKEIQQAVYAYVSKNYDGNNVYRDHIDLYEKPLIEAGLAKYGSQLKLAQVLGINRNTLRKKIYEHSID